MHELDCAVCFFFSSRRRHTRLQGDWSSDVCSSDLWQMARALREWLGPRPMLLERGLIALCVLGPLGFALLLPQPALRTGWFSAVHGLCLMALAGLCLDPQRPVARSWRYLMCGVAAFMGLMLFVRSYLALATPFLPSFTADSGANQIFALLPTLASTLLMVAGLD